MPRRLILYAFGLLIIGALAWLTSPTMRGRIVDEARRRKSSALDDEMAVTTGDSVIVQFLMPPADGEIFVQLVDGDHTRVRGAPGAAGFRQLPGLIEVDCRGTANRFELDIPRGLDRLELRSSDSTIFLRENGVVTTIWTMAADSTWQVSLTR